MLGRTLILSVFLVSACLSSSKDRQTAAVNVTTSHRLKLEDFVAHFSIRVERAADQIAKNADPSIQRNTILWKMLLIPMARRSLRRADDDAALMDLWLLCVRSTDAFSASGQAKSFFGDATPIALEASKELEQSIRGLAQSTLTEENFKAAAETISQHSSSDKGQARFPIEVPEKAGWDKAISGVLDKPIQMVSRPLNYVDPTAGLDQAATAAIQIAATVDRTRTDLNYMPDNLRWQLELLLMELQENVAFSSAVESWAQVGKASASLAETSSKLPGELRAELTTFIEDIESEHSKLQTTLKDLNTTVAGIEGALVDVDKIVLATDDTAKSLTTMAAAYSTLVGGVSSLMTQIDPPPDPSAEPAPKPVATGEQAPPFDITSYGATADKLTKTANGLTALLAELQVLTESKQSTVLLNNTEDLFSAMTNQLLLKGGALILMVGLVALGYRFAARKIA